MSGTRILLVEDDALLVRLIRRALVRKFSAVVDSAADGHVGLQHAAVHAYDLILSDIRMPEMDGISMVRRIRQDSGPNQSTPVVLLTGDHEEGEEAAVSLDARFVGKPFTRQALYAVVEDYLQAS